MGLLCLQRLSTLQHPPCSSRILLRLPVFCEQDFPCCLLSWGLNLLCPPPLAGWPLAELLTGTFNIFCGLASVFDWLESSRWAGFLSYPSLPGLRMAHLVDVRRMFAKCLVPSSPEQWWSSTTRSTEFSTTLMAASIPVGQVPPECFSLHHPRLLSLSLPASFISVYWLLLYAGSESTSHTKQTTSFLA